MDWVVIANKLKRNVVLEAVLRETRAGGPELSRVERHNPVRVAGTFLVGVDTQTAALLEALLVERSYSEGVRVDFVMVRQLD